MFSYFNQYFNNFKGFSKEIWILALVTFINRAGTMVLPFLSKYLKEDLDFSYSEVGWIMVCFGAGSMIGSWIGGKLSDTIGFYKVMIFSLLTSGFLLIFLQFVTNFIGLCMAMFFVMIIADMFRPAMFVSLGAYAKPENRTRALTLVRLAVNLGFAAGPALGGLIIMKLGYAGLFWIDGITCIIAIAIFAYFVKEKKKSVYLDNKHTGEILTPSIFKDKPYWVFLWVSFGSAILFFQLFTTLPIYHHEKYQWTEFQTGMLMSMNGFLVFLIEMPLVTYYSRKKTENRRLILIGVLLIWLSFIALLFDVSSMSLIISMLLVTIGEMYLFPFANSFAMGQAPKGSEGRYMALYTMTFSLAHIFSAKIGLDITKMFGYYNNWLFMSVLGLLTLLLSFYLKRLNLPKNV